MWHILFYQKIYMIILKMWFFVNQIDDLQSSDKVMDLLSSVFQHINIKLPFSRFAFLKVDWRVRGTTIRLEKAYALTDEAHWNTNSLRTSTNSLYSKQPRINAPLVLLAWLSTTDFTYMQAIYELNSTVRSSILLHLLYISTPPYI